MTEHLLILLLLYLVLGAVTGLLAGLLGVGGGLVAVPGLVWCFEYAHFPSDYIMHFAVGTSLAVMTVTAGRTIFLHRSYHVEFWSIFRRMAPGVAMGVIAGVVLGRFLHSRTLEVIFGLLALIIAIDMFLQRKINPARQLPGIVGISSVSLVLGGLSGLLGVGGGTFVVPFLTYCNISMRAAMVVSIASACVVSLVGSVAVMIAGTMHNIALPWATGFIYWPAWAFVVIGSLLCVRAGVMLAYRLPVTLLRQLFAVVLLFLGIRLLI